MVRFLEVGFEDDLTALQSHSWKGKAIKVFLNADYEFLCKIMIMPQREMHNARDHSQPRPLNCQCVSIHALEQKQRGVGEKRSNKAPQLTVCNIGWYSF